MATYHRVYDSHHLQGLPILRWDAGTADAGTANMLLYAGTPG